MKKALRWHNRSHRA